MGPQIRMGKGRTDMNFIEDNIVVIGFNQLWIDVEAIPCVLPW